MREGKIIDPVRGKKSQLLRRPAIERLHPHVARAALLHHRGDPLAVGSKLLSIPKSAYHARVEDEPMQSCSAFRWNDHDPVLIILRRSSFIIPKRNEFAVQRVCRKQALQVAQFLQCSALDGNSEDLLLALVR